VLIKRAAVLAIKHFQAEPLDGAAAVLQSLATSRCRLAGFGMGAQQMLNRLWMTAPRAKALYRERISCSAVTANCSPAINGPQQLP